MQPYLSVDQRDTSHTPEFAAQRLCFCAAHAAELARMGSGPDESEIRRFEKLHKKTATAFGFEWNTYQVTTPEEDLVTLAAPLTGFDPQFYRKIFFADIFTYMPSDEDVRTVNTSFLRGRTVIEMGCGMGKYVQTVARYCDLAIGLDLSHSLERARQNTRHLPNVLLVQGNILAPPFRPGSFDYVSIRSVSFITRPTAGWHSSAAVPW